MDFRGLDASSTQGDIREAFPGSREERKVTCDPDQVVDTHPERDTLCKIIEVDDYKVNGVDYKLTFQLSTDGTLAYVSLHRSFGLARDSQTHVSGRMLRSTYLSLSQLFLLKYGDPVEDWPLTDGRIRETDGRIKAEYLWQPEAGVNYRAGVDRISVSLRGTEGERAGHYWGRIHVFYSFAPRSQLDRI